MLVTLLRQLIIIPIINVFVLIIILLFILFMVLYIYFIKMIDSRSDGVFIGPVWCRATCDEFQMRPDGPD